MNRPSSRGRKVILTSMTDFNDIRVLADVLNDALKVHRDNVQDMNFLINYYLGEQPILEKTKDVRAEINNKIVVNLANSAVRDVRGYTFGTPVVYASRTLKHQDELARINDANSFESKSSIDSKVAEYMLITGVGYRALFPEKVVSPDEEPFRYVALDPRDTFLIRSTEAGNEPVLAVIMSKEIVPSPDAHGYKESTIYTVYSKNKKWVFKSPANIYFGIKPEDYVSPTDGAYQELQILNTLPVEEFNFNQWRLGFFEVVLDILDGINATSSDTLDDIEQKIRSKLIVTGLDPRQLGEEVPTGDKDADGNDITVPFNVMMQTSEVLCFSGEQGVNQDAKFVNNTLDYAGVSNFRDWLESMYYYVLGLPSRTSRASGGQDTGQAVMLRDGWASLETVARNIEVEWLASERNALKRLLEILRISGEISQIANKDIDITIGRNKFDNILTKVQAGQTMNEMNLFDPVDIVKTMDITTDPEEMVARGKKYQEEKREEELAEQEAMLSLANAGVNTEEESSTGTESEG